MLRFKKKHKTESKEPEEEHLEIDFDRIFLLACTRFGYSRYEAERMTFGKWVDVFHSYKEIYNFETKGGLYDDIEKEIEQYRRDHQPVTSLLSL